MSDDYDVLPIPVTLGGIIDKESLHVKPFVGIYFPVEILNKMDWTKDTRLTLTVEKNCLKIVKASAERGDYFTTFRDLTYEPIDEM